jgi:hypothetical protein
MHIRRYITAIAVILWPAMPSGKVTTILNLAAPVVLLFISVFFFALLPSIKRSIGVVEPRGLFHIIGKDLQFEENVKSEPTNFEMMQSNTAKPLKCVRSISAKIKILT